MNTKLKVLPDAGTYRGGCGGPEHCAGCELFQTVCPGNRGRCTTKKTCVQRECYGECNTCGGGPSAPETAPAICCKSPLKDLFLREVRGDSVAGKERYEYTPRDKIDIKSRGIVVTQGSVGSAFGTGYAVAPEVDAVGVNLRHVWAARNGWWSRDMKDYLRVPKKTKLILFTSGYDDTLEKAWDASMHEEDYTKVGFDYWQNLSFSIYSSDSPMQAYFSALRRLKAVQESRSWFAAEIQPGFMVEQWAVDRMLEQTEKIPQIALNMQFVGTKKKDILDNALDIQRLDRIIPKKVSFWIHGPMRVHVLKVLRSICVGRDLYFMSSGPWIAGHKGQLLQSDGSVQTNTSMSRKEIVYENQRRYARLAAG